MEKKYLVATGATLFTQHAQSPRQAMTLVKDRLRAAYNACPNRHDPNRLSRSLVEAFAAGRLNFVVFDGERKQLLCGEDGGVYEQPVTRKLADSLRHFIPDAVEIRRRSQLRAACAPVSGSHPGEVDRRGVRLSEQYLRSNYMPTETYINAGHPATGPDELFLLARHEDAYVRRRVAENSNTPINVLLLLVTDPDPDVRVALALHPVATFQLLLNLVNDNCVDVRYELAECPHLPLQLLHMLSQDENPFVADRAARSLSLRKRYFRKLWEGFDMAHHIVKVFTGGTAFGYETLNTLASVIFDATNCDIIECDIRDTKNLAEAEQYGVSAVPTIVVDNKIACVGRPTVDDLIELGIPTLLSA